VLWFVFLVAINLNTPTLDKFQDLEAEDFEQQQGARGKFYLLCCPTLMFYLCLHAVKLNIICLHTLFHITLFRFVSLSRLCFTSRWLVVLT
jgi:hypothetical protein